jgi:hypothetical protein
MKKLLLHFAVLFFLLTIGFIYFTMMPQMTSEEEGPLAEFSTARAFTKVQNTSNPIMWALKTTIKLQLPQNELQN